MAQNTIGKWMKCGKCGSHIKNGPPCVGCKIKKFVETIGVRSSRLYSFFGWQGGTIHQLSEETGVDMKSLLYKSPQEHDEQKTSWPVYFLGKSLRETGTLAQRLEGARTHKGNVDFWLGVAGE